MARGRAWLAVCLATLAAACQQATPVPPAAADPAPTVAAPEPVFQRWLDGAGIAFTVPASGKAILVNIPAFELIGFDDGAPVLRSRVIVGSPRNPSPILATYTSAVRFRPSWRPTPEMVASGEYRDRIVPPGSDNPLGLAAVRLQPGLLVYLHDTDRRQLFDQEMRALSHGCIRVQRWDELIAWLLGEQLATVQGWAEGSRTFDVPTPPVPVTIGYFTVFPDDSGTLQRYADVYGRMAAADPTAVPVEVACAGG